MQHDRSWMIWWYSMVFHGIPWKLNEHLMNFGAKNPTKVLEHWGWDHMKWEVCSQFLGIGNNEMQIKFVGLKYSELVEAIQTGSGSQFKSFKWASLVPHPNQFMGGNSICSRTMLPA